MKKDKSTVTVERKTKVLLLLKENYLVILDFAITVHKSQGSTQEYLQSDLSQSTSKRTAMGKNYQQPIPQGQFYLLLSLADYVIKFCC